VSRRIAGAAIAALWVSIAPLEARAPRPPPTLGGWDLFVADRLLSGLRVRDLGALADPLPATPSRPAAATPEPATVVLAALGITGLAGRPGRRRRR